MESKQGITELTVKPSFYVESVSISRHLDGLDSMASSSVPSGPPGSSLIVKSTVINFRWSASGSSAVNELIILWDSRQCSKNQSSHWSATLWSSMVQTKKTLLSVSVGIVRLTSSAAHAHCQVRPQDEITNHGVLTGACQMLRINTCGLTWLKIKRVSVRVASSIQGNLRSHCRCIMS